LPLVPQTGVTIKNMADSLPAGIETLVDDVLRWHRSVCVAAPTAAIAHDDPAARPVPRVAGPTHSSWLIPDPHVLIPNAPTCHI
jgi:hypothetical protein